MPRYVWGAARVKWQKASACCFPQFHAASVTFAGGAGLCPVSGVGVLGSSVPCSAWVCDGDDAGQRSIPLAVILGYRATVNGSKRSH